MRTAESLLREAQLTNEVAACVSLRTEREKLLAIAQALRAQAERMNSAAEPAVDALVDGSSTREVQ